MTMRVVDGVASGREAAGLGALVALTKPAIARMVVLTTLAGAFMAPGRVALGRLGWTLAGTLLVVGAANALNMFLERDTDALMQRTRTRPIPSGRVSPDTALWFGVALAFIGLPMLSFLVGPVPGLLAAVALISYVLVYTPLKRVTHFALHVGALPGAIPPLIGWASTSAISWRALLPFAILLVWQIPHFYAIALFHREEYAAAGQPVLPNTAGLAATKRAVVRSTALLVIVSLLPVLLGTAGFGYLAVAIGLGAVFFGWALAGLRTEAGQGWARSLFFASMPYLVLVLAALAASAA